MSLSIALLVIYSWTAECWMDFSFPTPSLHLKSTTWRLFLKCNGSKFPLISLGFKIFYGEIFYGKYFPLHAVEHASLDERRLISDLCLTFGVYSLIQIFGYKKARFYPYSIRGQLGNRTQVQWMFTLGWSHSAVSWRRKSSASEGLNLGFLPVLQSDRASKMLKELLSSCSQKGLFPCCYQGISQHKRGMDIL